MGRESNSKEIFKFAGTYLSVCIGSGFATGQEIMQFFSAHGMISIISSIICMVIMSYSGASLLEIGKTQKLKSSNEIFTYLCGNLVGGFLKTLMPIFFICSSLGVLYLLSVYKSVSIMIILSYVLRFFKSVENYFSKNYIQMKRNML